MCNNQLLNSQRIQFTYVRKSHKTMFYRDILNIKLSSLFNQSTNSTYNSIEICNKQLNSRNIIYGRKSHNSMNCRDIAAINFTNQLNVNTTISHESKWTYSTIIIDYHKRLVNSLCANEMESSSRKQQNLFTITNPQVITITPGVISNDRKFQLYLQRWADANL